MLLKKKMELFSLIKKRGQIWSFDLLIAFIIFVMGLIVVYFYAVNYSSGALDEMGQLSYDAFLASDLLLGEDNFSIVADGKINQTKLEIFDALTDKQKKDTLGISSNVYFYFDGLQIMGVPQASVGIVNTSQTENQMRVTRISVYQNKIITFEVISWS